MSETIEKGVYRELRLPMDHPQQWVGAVRNRWMIASGMFETKESAESWVEAQALLMPEGPMFRKPL